MGIGSRKAWAAVLALAAVAVMAATLLAGRARAEALMEAYAPIWRATASESDPRWAGI